MGTPIAIPSISGIVGQPVTEYGRRGPISTARTLDNDRTTVDMFTARFKNDVTSWLTVTNDTRFAYYDRFFFFFFAQTATNCSNAVVCANPVINGNLNVPYAYGGPAGYSQSTNGAQNITTAIAKFNTGFLRHELITGVDVNNQNDDRIALANSITKTGR